MLAQDPSVDPSYAHRVFEDLLPIASVLAEREHHSWLTFDWDCTYAIVAIGPDAPEQAPTRARGKVGWRAVFGGDWQPTPVAPLGDTTRDALNYCSRYFGKDVQSRLEAAAFAPGSWYVRDDVGETVFIYSIPQRIAARIRYGD